MHALNFFLDVPMPWRSMAITRVRRRSFAEQLVHRGAALAMPECVHRESIGRLKKPRGTVAYTFSVNKTHLYNICTMLDLRRRRWADVVQMFYKCFVFAGFAFQNKTGDVETMSVNFSASGAQY